MAITFDAQSGTTSNSATSLSWNHTVSGDYLIVYVTGSPIGTISGGDGLAVTCNSTPMSLIHAFNRYYSSPGNIAMWMFGMATPPTGSVTIDVTKLTSSNTLFGASISLSGVDSRVQVAPLPVSASGSSTSPAATIPWASGELVVACLCQGVAAQTITVGGGQTERRQQTSGNGFYQVSITTAAQASHAWTLAASTNWLVGGVALKPTGSRGRTFLRGRTTWEAQMAKWGTTHAATISTAYAAWNNGAGDTSKPGEFATNLSYYDGTEVHRRISEYGIPDPYVQASVKCQDILVRGYYIPNNGAPGYQHFTRGLWLDYLRAGTANSKTTVLLLRDNAAYSHTGDVTRWTLSRECAYGINAHVMAGRLGYSPDGTRRTELVNKAYGHLDQWFVSHTAIATVPGDDFPAGANGKWTMQPFMVALTARALIEDYEETGDSRCIPALRGAADFLAAQSWDPATQAMWYQNWTADVTANPIVWDGPTDGSADLNILIAPMFAWLALKTGIRSYATVADQLFQGGVIGGYLANEKQFNQNHTWGFAYLAWRTALEQASFPRGVCAGAL